MSYEVASPPVANARQRYRKFTPERIRQIKDLLARGETCEQIAATIGVTVGSLKVTCSRLGISLRRPRVKLVLPKSRANGTETTVDAARETATLTISIKYKGRELGTKLPLPPNIVTQLALEASFRDRNIGELTKDLIESVMRKGLVQELVGERQACAGEPGKAISPNPLPPPASRLARPGSSF